MSKIKMTINNREVEAYEGQTVLEAAKNNGIHIPTLCYLKDVTGTGACRVCQVEIEGAKTLCAACVYPVREGLVVKTNSQRALDARRRVVELIVSNHSKDCLSCIRNTNCELQRLCQELGVREDAFAGEKTAPTFDEVSPGIVRNTSKCVLCGRCVETCAKTQGLGILGFMNRGFKTKVGPVYDKSMNDVNCMQCGQCINVCPVGALQEKEEVHNVIAALNDDSKHVVVQTAPAVRASLGEEFGMPIGTRVTGKMVHALKLMGFDRVYDTNFGADLTIMEEGYEFIHRISNDGVLPMITSCSPGWVNYIEHEYPELLDHLSSCKSPHMMLGSMIKSYYAKENNLDPKDIYVVSIMPCVAKKGEKEREENLTDGLKDVDAVLTTRELGKLIKMFGINFRDLKDEDFDQDMFGEYTGAGVIFGASGGVMEAALRTVTDVLTKEQRHKNMKNIRGKDTRIEVILRKALWNKGYRYRKNYKKLPGSPDIALTKYKIAIFCDGEFFHGKDWEKLELKLKNSNNSEFWIKKISRNMERDDEINKKLNYEGWTVIRFWGEDIKKYTDECVKTVEEAIFDVIICDNDEG